ncbi:MAG: GNAT family N-acetyltransferase [Pyrinomonadaceae bacterium]|nr:GNAT family N-acetyltransferase [Pyrinomonadaceae bacterium]
METTFKLAEQADVNLLVELMEQFYEFEHLAFDEQIAREALGKLLGDASLGRVWLIQYGEQPIGYVVLTFGFSLEFRGRNAIVDELYIRPGYREQGAGKRALAFVEHVCRALGIEALRLEVERANTNAQAVYRKFGFKDHDRYLMTKWISH